MEKKTNKLKLIDIFQKFIYNSKFIIEESKQDSDINYIKIKDCARKFELYYLIKNISGSGWTNKNHIRRIQVSNFSDTVVSTNKKRTHMLCGVVNYEGTNILVVWNSYRYLNHTTNRSCYVYLESIKKAAANGYLVTKDFDQEIWLCDENNFNLLIRDYISFNYMG